MDRKSKQTLTPSGLNSRFCGDNLAFDDYIELMRNILIESRRDLTPENAGKIITANSPFSLEPKDAKQPIENGILLIHGLFDSPFYVRDLAEYFRSKGFLARAILLPGHGTVPGDLLNINYLEWVKAVNYGVDSLRQEVKNIYLGAYSLGGTLALHHVLNYENDIKGLLLFAPAIKPKNRLTQFIIRKHHYYTWTSSRAKWYQVRVENNFAKYNSHSFNAGFQACQLIEQVESGLKKTDIDIPLFVVISSDDETISDRAILSFFSGQLNPKSRLLLYTNKDKKFADERIIRRASHFPNLRILNFSHTCITISPDNPILGNTSKFLDLVHYPDSNKFTADELYLGAATKENLKNFKISRLSYNPDFKNLLQDIDRFLATL